MAMLTPRLWHTLVSLNGRYPLVAASTPEWLGLALALSMVAVGLTMALRGGRGVSPPTPGRSGEPRSTERRRYLFRRLIPLQAIAGGIGAAMAGASLAGTLIFAAAGGVVGAAILVLVTWRRSP